VPICAAPAGCIDGSTALRGVLPMTHVPIPSRSTRRRMLPRRPSSLVPFASSAGNDRRAKRLPGAALRFACADHPLAL